jgi:hypothetical protein
VSLSRYACPQCWSVVPENVPCPRCAAIQTKALQDAIDAIRAACGTCDGDGIDPSGGNCTSCGLPIAAVKALMGGPEAARAKVRS